MKIASLTIRGFRCFDETGETILLDDLSCFIGPNASGKTAAMIALARLFGESQVQRRLVPSDFHLAAGEDLKSKSSRILSIECQIAFPELEREDGDHAAIPEAFNQMIVDRPNGTPYCRIRLTATWEDDGTPAGTITEELKWILTSTDEAEELDERDRRKITATNRSRIRVIYVPPTRDPEQQIKATATTIFGRLLNSLAWNGADKTIQGMLTDLQSTLGNLQGVKTMNSQIQKAWSGFYEGRVARDVAFQALEDDPASLVNLLVPTFRPGEDERSVTVSGLSDGLRSLFSLSLSQGLFQVEKLLRARSLESGFKPEVADVLPNLTIFAVEEPENHLSPQYLGRVVSELAGVALDNQAQVVISSHSPSILGRVEPDNVRYFLGHEHTEKTKVKPISLPEDRGDEAFKYVREAVRGFPELYFSRLVILGEGASEEVVLSRLFKASGTPLDSHFISVVPLGGRHVNHFWQLLHGLGIPFLTLLDLDREKEGGGWGRIQYVRNELVQRFGGKNKRLEFTKDGNTHSIADATFDTLQERSDTDIKALNHWLAFFEREFDIFFASPLDLDFSMLEAFPSVYKRLIPTGGGPRLPDQETPDYKEAIERRMKQVLAADVLSAPPDLGSTYLDAQRELFAWYKYLFVERSKPVAHMRALLGIPDGDLVLKSPKVLKNLVARAQTILAHTDGQM